MPPTSADSSDQSLKSDDIPPLTRGADRRPTILPGGRQPWEPPTDGTTMEDLYRIRENDRRKHNCSPNPSDNITA